MTDSQARYLHQPSSKPESEYIRSSRHPKKHRNHKLRSLARTISPPPSPRNRSAKDKPKGDHKSSSKSAAAAIEAGEHVVEDHLTFYSKHLQRFVLQPIANSPAPRIDLCDWVRLYEHHAGSLKGSHFVVHQHDHPISGTHYDLRLQCNPTSSISFAIMYGLPGDPNSRRLNRNATETRVHCLWNHLIETASYTTGSMLIWDSGWYEVLPYQVEQNVTSSSDREESAEEEDVNDKLTQQQKLARAFRKGKVKLRLHGTRLSSGNYTLALRLSKEHKYRTEQPKRPSRRRRRNDPVAVSSTIEGALEEDSERPSSQEKPVQPPPLKRSVSSLYRMASPPPSPRREKLEEEPADIEQAAHPSEDENEIVRANNAYPGATNDIGSIHQRKWYVSLDRAACGFEKRTERSTSGSAKTTWIGGFGKFVVGGRETERSVVTGRVASQILQDEGVVSYVPRGLWRSIDY